MLKILENISCRLYDFADTIKLHAVKTMVKCTISQIFPNLLRCDVKDRKGIEVISTLLSKKSCVILY